MVQIRPNHPATVVWIMVESDHDEERNARVEQMIDALKRENAAREMVTGDLDVSVEAITSNPPASGSALKRRRTDPRR